MIAFNIGPAPAGTVNRITIEREGPSLRVKLEHVKIEKDGVGFIKAPNELIFVRFLDDPEPTYYEYSGREPGTPCSPHGRAGCELCLADTLRRRMTE